MVLFEITSFVRFKEKNAVKQHVNFFLFLVKRCSLGSFLFIVSIKKRKRTMRASCVSISDGKTVNFGLLVT